MEKRTLGRTGLEVTRLGFGAMEIRGPRVWGGREVTDEQSEKILNAVLDAGINFIDTANDYGRSEELIGRFISTRRKEYYLATKCGCCLTPSGDHDETPHLWTRDNLLRNIDDSLATMKTDYVDILQLHNPSVEDAEKGKLVDALREIQESGKTKFISLSSTHPYLETFLEWGVFDTFQIPYSALERDHEQAITKVAQAGAGTIIRGGIAQGTTERGASKWERFEKAHLDELRRDMGPREFVLRFTLTHPDIHTIIVGTLDPAHLKDNIEAVKKGPLPADVYEEAKRRLDGVK
jgi:aryl-alcohol dehydrogenase-like predicted oxidoreductase